MIPNLMEDYVIHIQQHRSIEVGVLQLAVLSDVECMHTHHEMLEDGVWTRVATKYLNTGNEDIVSLRSYLPCGVTTDVEYFSAKSERYVDFVHHDGEMFEIIPSSDLDLTPKEETDHSDVKQDITKKRRAVFASSHARIQFTADRNFYSANDLYCESVISVNILSNMVSQQHPQTVCLCRHLASKVVCDPFVNSSGSHCDEISIFWNEKHLRKYPASNLTDYWLTSFNMCTPNKGLQLDKHDKQDVFVEETLSGIQMHSSVIACYDRLKCMSEAINEQQGDCIQLHVIEKTILGLDGSGNNLPESSQLLSIHVEGFERSSINEPSFMKVNTAGLTEGISETVCDLESPTKGQQMLTMLVRCDCQMNKFELHMKQLTSCNLQTTECTEVQALETDRHFMQTLALRLQVPNLKEDKSVCSGVLLAICGLQLRPDELDLTLPWDPVTKSANDADKTQDMSTESFFQCHDNRFDHSLHLLTNDMLQKFTLGISFNDEDVSSWYEVACTSSSNKILNPVVNGNKQNATNVKQKTKSCDQHTGSSLDDFLLLRMGHMKKAVQLEKNVKHPSVPYEKCDMRGHTLRLIGSERITQASNLLLLLESRHNIKILECNYKELYQDSVFLGLGEPYYADVCVDDRNGIVLHDFCTLRDAISLEALTRRLARLSLQYCCCWVILLCYPLKNNMAYPDDHTGQTGSNVALLHEAVSQFSKTANDFDIKIHYSDSDIATADLVYSIAYKACQNTSWNEQDWLQRSWLKLQLSQPEKLLMRVPCITPFTAQLMSSTGAPPSSLLAMPLSSLIQLCPWIPHKMLELFVELSRDIPSISAGNSDSCKELAFYEPRNQDETEQNAKSVQCDHIAECWKSRIADQLLYEEQEKPLHHYAQDMLSKEDLNPHAEDVMTYQMPVDKMVIQENESRNPSCHWNGAEESSSFNTEQYNWKLGHSPFIQCVNSECNDDFIAKHKGDEQIMFRGDKHPTKKQSTSSKNSAALSKRDEVNKIPKSIHLIKKNTTYNQMATMSQTYSVTDNISDDNSLNPNVCSSSSDWIHEQETYFDNGMHHHSESVPDTDLECGVVHDNQCDIHVDTSKRQRLTYERIPGARDGQTRLTFI